MHTRRRGPQYHVSGRRESMDANGGSGLTRVKPLTACPTSWPVTGMINIFRDRVMDCATWTGGVYLRDVPRHPAGGRRLAGTRRGREASVRILSARGAGKVHGDGGYRARPRAAPADRSPPVGPLGGTRVERRVNRARERIHVKQADFSG